MFLVNGKTHQYFVYNNKQKIIAEVWLDISGSHIYLFEIEPRYRGRGYLRKIHKFLKETGIDFPYNCDTVVNERMYEYLKKEGYDPII